MKISDTVFGLLSRYGGILVLASTIVGVYLVMRNRELDKAVVQADRDMRGMMVRRQQMEGVLRDFIGVAANDGGVLQILQKHQIVSVQQQPAAQPQPGAAPGR